MAYSNDLRLRAVTYFHNNKAQYREVAAIFNVGLATLHDWVRRHRETGEVIALKSTGRPRLVSVDEESSLKELVTNNADKTLSDLIDKWHESGGKKMSTDCMSRNIRRLGFSYKKNFYCFRKGH